MNTKLSLFDGITPEEYNRMMVCFRHLRSPFPPMRLSVSMLTIPTASAIFWKEKPPSSAHTWTAARHLEYLKTGDVFGSALSALSPNGDSLQVICTKSCKIQFIDYAT